MKVSLKKHSLPGKLIAVCGADGTGKSTAISLILSALNDKSSSVSNALLLKQPSDWWRSDLHVQSTLYHQGNADIFDEFSLGVFGMADRFNQQALIIEPALAAGKTIIVDRYVFCLLAYYMARSEPLLDGLVGISESLFQPDITFILDCPPLVAIDRVIKRDGPKADMPDQKIGPTTAFINAYRALAQSNNLELISSLEAVEVISSKMLSKLRCLEDS